MNYLLCFWTEQMVWYDSLTTCSYLIAHFIPLRSPDMSVRGTLLGESIQISLSLSPLHQQQKKRRGLRIFQRKGMYFGKRHSCSSMSWSPWRCSQNISPILQLVDFFFWSMWCGTLGARGNWASETPFGKLFAGEITNFLLYICSTSYWSVGTDIYACLLNFCLFFNI